MRIDILFNEHKFNALLGTSSFHGCHEIDQELVCVLESVRIWRSPDPPSPRWRAGLCLGERRVERDRGYTLVVRNIACKLGVRLKHIAIQEALDGKVVEWMEKVADEEYNAAASTAE